MCIEILVFSYAFVLILTQVKFCMDENTTLSDLLSLNLHNFEDEVMGIVDKAVKEMSMEKVLKELDATWSTMEFEHEKHPRRGITMLKASEEVIETLEDNQVGFLLFKFPLFLTTLGAHLAVTVFVLGV